VRLDLRPERFRAFASRWGLLGLRDSDPYGPETVAEWKDAIGELASVFDVWCVLTLWRTSHADARDLAAVERYVYVTHGDWFEGRLDRPGLRAAATQLVQAQVNQALAEHTQAALVFEPAGGRKVGRLVPRVAPKSLIGAAWLQLYEDIGHNTPARRCARPSCRERFLMRTKRGHDLYCGPSCNQWAKRKRAVAKRLAARGWAPRLIANKIEVSSALVSSWLPEATGDE
jgi:hypothetical protein